VRELRDRDNKDLQLDKAYLAMKKLKDTYNPSKIANFEANPLKNKI